MPLSNKSRRKEELIQELALSRSLIRRQRTRVQEALDLKTQITNSVRKAPAKWAIGSAITGLVGSKVFRGRKKKVQHIDHQTVNKTKSSFIQRTLVSVIIGLVRPAITNYLKRRVSLPTKLAK